MFQSAFANKYPYARGGQLDFQNIFSDATWISIPNYLTSLRFSSTYFGNWPGFPVQIVYGLRNTGFPVNFVIFEMQMWISRTYDKFYPGFPVKTSLPGLDFAVNFSGSPVIFIKQKRVLHMGYGYFFTLTQ